MLGDICLKSECLHYLDSKECDRCLSIASGCAACGATPARFVRINSRPIWRGYQHGRCLSCALEKEIDLAEVCKQCNEETYEMRLRNVVLCEKCSSKYETLCRKCGERTDVYAENTLDCPTCYYGEDFIYDKSNNGPPYVSSRQCNTCGDISHLNASGQCKNCYVEESMAQAQGDDWGETTVCQQCRKITKRGRKICVSCALENRRVKTCRGCLTKFAFISKYDTFCVPCKENMQRGNCTMCGRMANMDNDRGWCANCVEEAEEERLSKFATP